MKTLIRLGVIVLALTQVLVSYAAGGISFDGPKITDAKIEHPGDFAVYQFKGIPKIDAAVPQVRNIWGLDNKDNWPSVTPNTYFNQNPLSDGGINIQTVAGQFDGDGGNIKDLLIADQSFLHFCYNYNGTACVGTPATSDDIPVKINAETNLTIWAVGIADFNGDGKDDVAVIGYDANNWLGYLVVYYGNNGGGALPIDTATPYIHDIKNGIPLSLAIGNFGGDGKPDIVVGNMTANFSLPDGAFGTTFTSTGASFNFADHTFKFDKKDCWKPTGLLAYDPDGANQSDLVLTCYDTYESTCSPIASPKPAVNSDAPIAVCAARYDSGPVISLQNNGSGSSFATKQTLKNLNFPYTSTVGDYNGDSILDLAVASNQGKSVVTFAGTAPFQVDEASRNDVSTLSYTPKYIQTQDMNGDGLPDLILSAASAEFPQPPVVEIVGQFNWDRLDVYQYQNNNQLNGGYYYAMPKDSAFADGITAGNFAGYATARTFTLAGPNHYVVNYVPNFGGNTSHSMFLQDGAAANLSVPLKSLSDILVNQIVPTDGVIVLINHRPTVSTDDPKCGGGEIAYRCTAQEGLTIAECTFSSSDSTLSSTPAVAGPGNKEWTGKVKLPNDKAVHKFTITAKDNLNTVTTGDFTVDYSNCPGGPTACPAKPIEKQISLKDPVILCAFENDSALAQQNAGKNVTWAQVGGKGISFSALTVQGQCLVAPHLPGSFEQDQEIDLQYSVLPDGPNNCPAKIINPKLFLQGSGQSRFGCSLNADSTRSSETWGAAEILLLLAVGALWGFRKASLKDEA